LSSNILALQGLAAQHTILYHPHLFLVSSNNRMNYNAVQDLMLLPIITIHLLFIEMININGCQKVRPKDNPISYNPLKDDISKQ